MSYLFIVLHKNNVRFALFPCLVSSLVGRDRALGPRNWEMLWDVTGCGLSPCSRVLVGSLGPEGGGRIADFTILKVGRSHSKHLKLMKWNGIM